MRKYETGATRDNDNRKLHYLSYLSPLSLERYARYMKTHETQKDGSRRKPDNWKLGIPKTDYLQSAFRHFIQVWKRYELGEETKETNYDHLAGVFFNIHGLMHEEEKERIAKGSREGVDK